MKIFGLALGYDEPFWYLGAWEWFIHDDGWTIAKSRVIWRDGAWPKYSTFHPIKARRDRVRRVQ